MLAVCALSLCSCRKQQGDPGKVLDDARRDADAGRYEQALQKQIWFHEHALETAPAYYGVRLSFALEQWIELGKKYPKALDELKKIRDKDVRVLLSGKGDADLFMDVDAIDSSLNEQETTVTLFKQLDKTQPAFASSVSYRAQDALVKAGEYSLARKYLGDPQKQFASAQQAYQEGLAYASGKTGKEHEMSQHAFEQIFAKRIVELITILDKTGEHQSAKDMQSQALKVLDNSTIRGCLNAT